MIADSPYDGGDLALAPGIGVIAGLVSSGLMLASIAPASRDVLWALTDIVPGSAAYDPPLRLIVGGTVHAAVGAAFGLLYAACQQRAPWHAMITVGLFYGFVLWVIGGLLARVLFSPQLHAAVGSTVYLRACVVYGLGLSCAAALSTIYSQKQVPVVVKD